MVFISIGFGRFFKQVVLGRCVMFGCLGSIFYHFSVQKVAAPLSALRHLAAICVATVGLPSLSLQADKSNPSVGNLGQMTKTLEGCPL